VNKKNILSIISLSTIGLSSGYSDENFSNYHKYNLTKTEFKLERVAEDLYYPWAVTFTDDNNLVVTEKNGRIYQVNTQTGRKHQIKHNIQHIGYDGGSIAYSQGGLLDAYFNNADGYIYFTYSHDFKDLSLDNKPSKASSTAIARGKLVNDEVKGLEILLIAEPRQQTNKHFGSRIAIKNEMLYAGFGERDMGMIAQDPKAHPGSIIRIKKNGEIPNDNPKFKGMTDWLPEIYLIGVRNPQGMTISPHDGEAYFSSHGPRGGDHIAKVKAGSNYGWKDIAWGGTEYSGFSIGNASFKDEYEIPVKTWVPSMAISSIQFYKGEAFPEWQGDLIICSLNGQTLIRLDYDDDGKIVGEEIIFKDKIGRIRDFDIDVKGNIYLVSDSPNSSLWKLSK
jgi:aldose sugar dehydrogenase|tara:strand:- start:10460 stop:11638 length:1179 start_codon:yes stop_codon:yes gene_type:complete